MTKRKTRSPEKGTSATPFKDYEILLVDEAGLHTEQLREHLVSCGAVVQIAATALDATTACRRGEFDLVILPLPTDPYGRRLVQRLDELAIPYVFSAVLEICKKIEGSVNGWSH